MSGSGAGTKTINEATAKKIWKEGDAIGNKKTRTADEREFDLV